MSTVSDQTNQRYEFLIRRAIEFLTEHGGRATEEQIVRHVFGSSASVELWSSLLQSVLANEPSLSLLADGRWALAGYAAPPTVSALGDFTALDVETTGLRPLTHRIIEVAAVRYRNGREVDSWVSFLNPDKALPATIINLTGIRDVDLEDSASLQRHRRRPARLSR
ncbi:MAG: exonuclease domain-containing protein [Thermomicrobiales bacterium]